MCYSVSMTQSLFATLTFIVGVDTIDCEISFVPGCIHFSVTWQCIVARPSSVFIGCVRILSYCVNIVVLKQLL